MNRKLRTILGMLVFGAVLLAPIILYAYQFGIGVWEDHSKWAEMGSAFSGIYSPLIAFLAFLILIGQARMQAKMNKHQYDQAYIQANKDDIHFFAEKIDSLLDGMDSQGVRVRSILKQFSNLTDEELRSEIGGKVSQQFVASNQKTFDLWLALYPCLIGLGSQSEYPYQHNYTGSILKVTALLSLESCIALDKVHYAMGSSISDDLRFWTRDSHNK